MAENEVFQTRLADDRARVIHDYMDGRNISKAEATRRFIGMGIEAHQERQQEDDQEDADARDRDDRIQILARLGEKIATISVLSAFATLTVWFLANLTVAMFNLSVGEFGYLLINGVTGTLFLLSAISLLMSLAVVAALLVLYGIESGWFGRHLAPRLPTPEETA